MVLTLIEKKLPLDCVLFVDLGKEFKSIYSTWERLTQLLDDHNIRHERIKVDFDYYFSEHKTKSNKCGYGWCGGRTRWGTTYKNAAIKRFYKENYEGEVIAEYVGIAADERDRIQIKRDINIKVYPLVLWGMTENDCLVKCYKNGFTYQEDNGVQLYQVLDRVSCFCCGNKNLNELKAMYKHLPQYWQRLRELQIKTDIPFKHGKSIKDLENRFKNSK